MGTVSPLKDRVVKRVVKKKKTSFFKRFSRMSVRAIILLSQDLLAFLFRQKKVAFFIVAVFLLIVGIFSGVDYMKKNVLESSSFSDEYILKKLGTHINLPPEYPISLVRVEDSEALKRELPLQTKLKNGDYIIVYPKLYIIYDAQHDTVVFTKESQREMP